MIMEEYILFVSSLRNDKKFENEVQLRISIEILFKNVYEKYEKVSELYFVMGLSGEIFIFLFLRTLTYSGLTEVEVSGFYLVFQNCL